MGTQLEDTKYETGFGLVDGGLTTAALNQSRSALENINLLGSKMKQSQKQQKKLNYTKDGTALR